jgi:hypothetical protein
MLEAAGQIKHILFELLVLIPLSKSPLFRAVVSLLCIILKLFIQHWKVVSKQQVRIDIEKDGEIFF